MFITIDPVTALVLDVSCWPKPQSDRNDNTKQRKRHRHLRRAANVLQATPSAFATEASIGAAYDRFEVLWNDSSRGQGDPLGELLRKQASRLRDDLEKLCARPRAMLRTEHRLLKLQAVRRTDAKTARWLSGQPGRSTAERAGARQRIKAPKRYETIATLENQVLRAFSALTVRLAEAWLAEHGKDAPNPALVKAHQVRARRVDRILRDHRVPEARPPVRPNFPLRFDLRYRKIWRAWQELREKDKATELQWMWQHRTFLELLAMRAAMKLQQAVRERSGGGVIAHSPLLPSVGQPHYGCYLNSDGLAATFGFLSGGTLKPIEFRTTSKNGLIGSVASAELDTEIWWDAQDVAGGGQISVGELPWTPGHSWDSRLEKWAARVISRSERDRA